MRWRRDAVRCGRWCRAEGPLKNDRLVVTWLCSCGAAAVSEVVSPVPLSAFGGWMLSVTSKDVW